MSNELAVGTRAPARVWRPRRYPRGAALLGWGLLAPALLLLLGMTIFPTVYLFRVSFRHENLLGPGSGFTGLANYVQVLTNPEVGWDAAATLLFVAVGCELIAGLALALLLSRKMRESNLLTALFVVPLGVAPVVSALIFRQLLNPAFGWIDWYAQAAGVMGEPVDWLSNPLTAWAAVIGLDVWQWTPFVALILLAGLQGVPTEPREAALVDGAGPVRLFWHITLPLLRPFVAIALVLRAIEAFKTFGSVWILTGGGPGSSTELINLDLYRLALQDFNVGAAAALGICFLLVLSAVTQQLLNVLGRNSDILED
jgi:multiple sugar transport system permease protein